MISRLTTSSCFRRANLGPLVARRSLVDVPLGGRTRGTYIAPTPAEASKATAVLYRAKGGVATVTLNQPENKNALSVDLVKYAPLLRICMPVPHASMQLRKR